MTRLPRRFVASVACISVLLVGAACRESRQEESPSPPYVPTATIKDLMLAIVDPSADVVWEAVATDVTASGAIDRLPKNDAEWANVRGGAIRLVEAANLLLMPGRHVARPGEKSENPGVELEPAEMDVLRAKDPAAWTQRVNAFHDSALALLAAVDARDPDRITDIGGELDEKCESCHVQYWYPNQVLPPGYRGGR